MSDFIRLFFLIFGGHESFLWGHWYPCLWRLGMGLMLLPLDTRCVYTIRVHPSLKLDKTLLFRIIFKSKQKNTHLSHLTKSVWSIRKTASRPFYSSWKKMFPSTISFCNIWLWIQVLPFYKTYFYYEAKNHMSKQYFKRPLMMLKEEQSKFQNALSF